ncbi:MAG TPA: orotate phosphoribosyltransferase [Methanospirillum sp.]|jgi:orotate phosphoribosyltransferase|uniref:orotate phosphoribosyltransferase n=1 Tax=Methanospirillum sp. TaxID=45200 RepID=UPI0009C533AB|nr:orotate phosphoribosyltransferase [Methanospirillum sp.]MCZ2417731.1 orotate phosphoribosyltransferase [Burkholderiales bacterium]OQB39204.1 MAG: Orotate phosphoribosyltransferase [Euryarchaeota archaeon ADurb.Bin165]HPY59307.1 orotate phosphoribosyltransferase [Methanospirillum sp.]HQB99762.1 orotate phosphoribosyltransferase [Methanospirillum sp.]
MVTATLHEMLISSDAIRFGDFTLASGRKSRFYIDIKKAITQPAILKKIASEVLMKNPPFDAVAGVAVGGVPLAVAVSLESGKPYVIIRKEQKAHGLASLIIGEVSGKRVLLVEDVTTSGGSALFGIEQLRSAGAVVEEVITVVDRDEGAEKTLSDLNVKLTPLVSMKDLVDR